MSTRTLLIIPAAVLLTVAGASAQSRADMRFISVALLRLLTASKRLPQPVREIALLPREVFGPTGNGIQLLTRLLVVPTYGKCLFAHLTTSELSAAGADYLLGRPLCCGRLTLLILFHHGHAPLRIAGRHGTRPDQVGRIGDLGGEIALLCATEVVVIQVVLLPLEMKLQFVVEFAFDGASMEHGAQAIPEVIQHGGFSPCPGSGRPRQ